MKTRPRTKIYYTRGKIQKLIDILKYRHIVLALSTDCFYPTQLTEQMKNELKKCGLRTYGYNVYDPTIFTENDIIKRLNELPEICYENKCIIMHKKLQ